jgi:hypothetical protein
VARKGPGAASSGAGIKFLAWEPYSLDNEIFYKKLVPEREIITGLTNETTYYLWVKAKNSSGISGFSPAASATPSNTGNASISVGFN